MKEIEAWKKEVNHLENAMKFRLNNNENNHILSDIASDVEYINVNSNINNYVKHNTILDDDVSVTNNSILLNANNIYFSDYQA